jgi:hypothetical protein
MAAEGGADDRTVPICVIVLTKRMKPTKSNDVMAFITVEDTTGSLEVLVFPKVLAAYGGVLNLNEAVVIEARISSRDEEDTKLVASRFFAPEDVKNGIPSARSGGLSSAETPEARQILFGTDGSRIGEQQGALHPRTVAGEQGIPQSHGVPRRIFRTDAAVYLSFGQQKDIKGAAGALGGYLRRRRYVIKKALKTARRRECQEK